MMIFTIFIALIAIQRLVELYIAKQNEKQLKMEGLLSSVSPIIGGWF